MEVVKICCAMCQALEVMEGLSSLSYAKDTIEIIKAYLTLGNLIWLIIQTILLMSTILIVPIIVIYNNLLLCYATIITIIYLRDHIDNICYSLQKKLNDYGLNK